MTTASWGRGGVPFLTPGLASHSSVIALYLTQKRSADFTLFFWRKRNKQLYVGGECRATERHHFFLRLQINRAAPRTSSKSDPPSYRSIGPITFGLFTFYVFGLHNTMKDPEVGTASAKGKNKLQRWRQ